MIVWQGLGFLVVIFGIVAFIAVQVALDAMFGTGFYNSTPWTKVVSGVIAAIPIWLVGYKLNNREGRRLVDPETNQEVNLVKRHTLFWIPMQYWAAVAVALGVFVAFIDKNSLTVVAQAFALHALTL